MSRSSRTAAPRQRPRRPPRPHGTQRGAVLLFGLVVLAVMLIGSVAMVRSVEQAVFSAGNQGFKRDMGNQAERAAAAVRDRLVGGDLATRESRESSRRADNYSASLLPENDDGIPLALIGTEGEFRAVADPDNDIEVKVNHVVVARVRWLLERLCSGPGPMRPGDCVLADNEVPGASGSDLLNAEDASAAGPGATPVATYYRLSVRVEGARGTRGFFQSFYVL